MFRIPVYVVSAKIFTDRQQLIRKQAEQYGLNLQFIWEYDATELSREIKSKFALNAMPIKSMSCVLKHLEAQRKLLESEHDVALVLEDDVLLFDDFANKLSETLILIREKNTPWLVFLGGMDNSLDSRFFKSERLTLIESPLTTAEAYLINRAGCELRLSWLESHKITKPADHLLKELDMRLGVTQFRVSSPFVTQGSITGRFTTTLDSSRAKKPAWYLNLRYQWNRFRKQYLPRLTLRIKASFR